MEIYRDIKEVKPVLENSVVAIGNFDGVHIGHKQIIKKCVNIATLTKNPSVVLTFDPHPSQFLKNNIDFKLICDFEEKVKLLGNEGIEYLITLKFNEILQTLTPENFLKKYLIQNLKVKDIVTGYNFSFGNNKSGNTEVLNFFSKKYNFSFHEVKPVIYDCYEVSSSLIRKSLKLGSIGLVNKLLGRKYTLSGKVVPGIGLAKNVSIATANVILDKDILYPLYGVYFVEVSIHGYKGKYYGIANIGLKPTLGLKITSPMLEVHIFNFNDLIYDLNIEVSLLHFIRPERNFGSIEVLIKQVKKDLLDANYILKNIEKIVN